jgi:hypothetical protein
VTFVLFVVINFLTTKDTKRTKVETQRKKMETMFNGELSGLVSRRQAAVSSKITDGFSTAYRLPPTAYGWRGVWGW